MPAVVTPVVVEPFSNGRSGNSTAAVGGDRGSGGRRQTPNDVSWHAGEIRERAVSSQGAAIAVPVVVGLAVVVPALVAPARKIETRKDRRSKGGYPAGRQTSKQSGQKAG